MIIDFDKLNENCKVAFFLTASQKLISEFSNSEDRIIVQDVIESCWKWLIDGEYGGEYLYDLLDDEEKGITIIQEMSEDKKDIVLWNCIIDAVAYTSRKAYEKEGARCFPQPIEMVDDTLVEHFISSFECCFVESERYIEKLFLQLMKNEPSNKEDLRRISVV